jgi:hypothetical protein
MEQGGKIYFTEEEMKYFTSDVRKDFEFTD